MSLTRRHFLGLVVSGAAAACSSGGDDSASSSTTGAPSTTLAPTTTTTTLPVPDLPGDPFTLGVASGDPLANKVMLWTRLAPDPLNGGGMPAVEVPVRWEVAEDEAFSSIVSEGVEIATPDFAHAVHVDAAGLTPDTPYFYRFTVGDFTSTVGRTRTFPNPGDSPERLRFAFASCQNWKDGYYTSYPHLAEEELDLVVYLGDYIYESGLSDDGVRQHNSDEVVDLAGYRNRYALYKSDPGLQAVHAKFPWIVTWDDHEVDNNYAGDSDQDGTAPATFLARRAQAYQAYYEHQPVRLDTDSWDDVTLYRTLTFGDLASFFVLDTRQHRSNQACARQSDLGAPCPEMDDPARTLLGADQEAWLFEGLFRSTATWNVLAQQVVMSEAVIKIGDGVVNFDQWDGYPAQRQRLLDLLADQHITNPVVITGDIHASGVGDLRAVTGDAASPIVGTEFVGTSISSDFPPAFVDLFEAAAAQNPNIRYANASQRGYVRCEMTRDELRADYQLVASALTPTSPIATAASFVVRAGTPGATQA
jgi:alkaline phosphatase D